MEKYFKRTSAQLSSPAIENDRPKQSRVEDDLEDLPSDPGLRKRISDYHPDKRDQIRREYLQRGPCQPIHDCVQTQKGQSIRRFVIDWYKYFPEWLEYSISKDAAFCLYCYLFKPIATERGGGDCFSGIGFSNFRKKEKLHEHVGKHNSFHNQALKKGKALMDEKQHIRNIITPFVQQSRVDYRVWLGASVDCIQFLLRQGLAFRGHDESESSCNQGNFLELLQFLVDHNEEVRAVALKNAPENLKMISPKIQKEIVHAAAVETTNAILRGMGDASVDQWMNDCLVVYIEKDVFKVIDNESVLQRFQKMAPRRGQL